MIEITWVEIILLGAFAGTFALSVRFCISTYAHSESRDPARKLDK